jgi:hypothetical protein
MTWLRLHTYQGAGQMPDWLWPVLLIGPVVVLTVWLIALVRTSR